MNRRKLQYLPGAVLLLLGSVPLLAQVPLPHSFQSGDTARASEVNANFTALKDAVEALQSKVAQLEANQALDLDSHVEVTTDKLGHPTVRFTGVNLQVVNGVDQTTANGLGNLIVGYNKPRAYAEPVCSDGRHDNQSDCETNGEMWTIDHKSGSHNIVGGSGNAYSSTGGLVVGEDNAINGPDASITGGTENIASGDWSSISGGRRNTVSGFYSSVSGGWGNTSSGNASSVSGGRNNTASSYYSSVVAGSSNTASGGSSSVSGGHNNVASSETTSISGGHHNTASGASSSILGGSYQNAASAGETIPAIP